jgi:hypothetical protein
LRESLWPDGVHPNGTEREVVMSDRSQMGRRAFLSWMATRGAGLGLAGASLPTLLAACSDEPAVEQRATPAAAGEDVNGGTAIVGDVVDFELTSDEWEGAFGFVTLRLHAAHVDGREAFFIRTDASDQEYARSEGLVFVPRLSGLVAGNRTGDAYLLENGSVVLSSDPSREGYTPAWRLHRVGGSADLRSAKDVRVAEASGDAAVESTAIVVNWPVVAWPDGGLPIDTDLKDYLGGGQLIESPDTSAMTATFKLHECFPGSRYIVCDTSLPPMAEGMQVAASPRLAGASPAGATGFVNVFMNGLPGSGPMGFQPSVFDSTAGDPAWSPYWDHMTYAWKDGVEPRPLESQAEIERARDAGELDGFPGTPDTGGETFVVNCPVPVLAPNTFRG